MIRARHRKTLNETIGNLIALSDILESIRGKFGHAGSANLSQSQKYLSACIDELKKGESMIKQASTDEFNMQYRSDNDATTRGEN